MALLRPIFRDGRVLLLLALLLAVPGAARGERVAASEYDVKAAFLLNFTKFVEWPPAAFSSDTSMLLCVLGDDPFGKSLELVSGEQIAGRKVQLLRIREMPEPEGCQIVFVSRSERRRLPEILTHLRGEPVLTVADTGGFLEQGGIINFTLEGSKVRFEINQDAAGRAGIKISSKLLRLATRVKGSPEP